MKKFNKKSDARGAGGYRKGAPGPQKHKSHAGNMRERAKPFKAVCASCKSACEVPFRPTGDRPVYCSDCFEKKDTKYTKMGAQKQDHDTRVFSAGERLGNRAHKEPYTKHAPRQTPDLHDVQKKIEKLEWKLDQILELLNPPKQHVMKKAELEESDAPPKEVDDNEK